MMMVMLVSVFSPAISASEIKSSVVETKTKEMPAEIKVMFTRLEEIRAMDRSTMNYSEKKALRKEVRNIKADLKSSNNGVYLSVGAIIIIILLLILIL